MGSIVCRVMSILSWIICIYAGLVYGFMKESMLLKTLSEYNFFEGRKRLIISFFLIVTLILLKIIYLTLRNARENMEKILNSLFPFLYVTFGFIFSNVISIKLSSEKTYGVLFNLFKNNYFIGACALFTVSAFTWSMISIKTYLALNRVSSNSQRIKLLKKPVVWFVASVGVVVEIINISYFIIFRELSNDLLRLFYTMPVLYFCGYFLIFLISKCREFLVIDKKAN